MENDNFDNQINSALLIKKSNIPKIKNTTQFSRPETPHIDLLAIRSIRKNEPEQIIKNFSSFVKQIIDTENEKFLNGEINLIEYIISKYTNVNISNLNELKKLSLKINAEFGLLNQFGQKLPNLNELRLNNSNIVLISSIGTEFRNLRILHVNSCNIKDLSGMVCFSSLEVFEAKDNKIDDLIELEMCTTLKMLDLKNNLIKEEDNISFLSSLTELNYLNLNGNPIQTNENYKNLIKENLHFIEKIDIEEEICSPHISINKKKINNLNNSKNSENTLDMTNCSKDTNSQSKFNSTINLSETNNSLRPPSRFTLRNFYNKEMNPLLQINSKNNILETNQMTKTAINWKYNTDINSSDFSSNSNNNDIQGIQSILTQNRQMLNKISSIDNNNNLIDLDNSLNNNTENSINLKQFSETARIFSSRGSGAINTLKPIVKPSALRPDEKVEIKPIVKKPIIFKSGLAKNNNAEFSDTRINLNIPSSNKDDNMSKTTSGFIKFKTDVGLTPLKPIIIKKTSNNNDNMLNVTNNDNNISVNNNDNDSSFILNSEKKFIFKNKPIINKTLNSNNNSSLLDESGSPKKLFLNPTILKNKDPISAIKLNKITSTVRIQIDEENKPN